MRIMAVLLLAFTIVPALELALLLEVGSRIGALQTFAIIVLTGILGASLAKHQGALAWRRVRQTMREGKLPKGEVADAFLILVAGIVLVTPGFVTDVIGLLLLLPLTRHLARRLLLAQLTKRADLFKVRWHIGGQGHRPRSSGAEDEDVIDVESTVVDDEKPAQEDQRLR